MGTLADIITSGVRAEDLPPDLASQLDPLLRFVNTGIGGLQQQMQNSLTLTDNLACEIVTPVLTHGVSQIVQLKKLKTARMVIGCSVAGQKNGPNHALAFPPVLQQSSKQGQVKITCYFLDSTATRVQVAIALVPEGQGSSATPSTGVWTAPTLLNSWTNYGGGFMAVGYFKDAIGIVRLRGTCINAPGTAANVNMFVLPAGLLPSAIISGSAQDVTTDAGSTYRRVKIDTSGQIFPVTAVAVNTILSLDGISFDTR